MKQDDKMSLVDAMEKEIADHEAGNHWSVISFSMASTKDILSSCFIAFRNVKLSLAAISLAYM